MPKSSQLLLATYKKSPSTQRTKNRGTTFIRS